MASSRIEPSIFRLKTIGMRRMAACAFGALLCVFAISLNLAYIPQDPEEHSYVAAVKQFCEAWPTLDATYQLVLCFIAVFFLLLFGCKREPLRVHWPVIVLSVFAGFAMTFGWTLDNGYDIGVLLSGGVQKLKAVFVVVGWATIAYAAFTLSFRLLDRAIDGGVTPWRHFPPENARKPLTTRFLALFDAHPFIVPLAVLGITWLPTIIGYQPALFMGDTFTQINMWYGFEHDRLYGITLVDPSITVTTHHPVLHTAIVGLCVQFGQNILGNENAGIAAYAALQCAANLLCLSYAFLVAKRLGVPAHWRAVVLLLLVFVPWYSTFAVVATKDSPFADALLVFCLQLLLLWRDSRSQGFQALTLPRMAALIVSGILLSLLRNGALLFAVAGLIVAALVCIPRKAVAMKQMIACLLAVAVAVFGFNNVLVPAMKVTPATKVEIMSVPFQQTARYLGEHPNDVTDAEQQAIDAILGFEGLAERYYPNNSDPVKDYAAVVCEHATTQQWMDYFAAWASMGVRHPGCYIEATMANYYGYFYIGQHNNMLYDIANSNFRMSSMNESGTFDFHRTDNPAVKECGDFVTAYVYLFKRMPLVSLPLSPAFWCWFLLLGTAYAIRRRWRFAIPALLTLWLVMLVFLIGPMNGNIYNRYVYPIAFVLPFLLVIMPAMHLAGNSTSARTPKHAR